MGARATAGWPAGVAQERYLRLRRRIRLDARHDMEVSPVEFPPALECRDLEQEGPAGQIGAERPRQFTRGAGCSSGREHIVDNQHPSAVSPRVAVRLERILAVL